MKACATALFIVFAILGDTVRGEDLVSDDNNSKDPMLGWETVVVSPAAEIFPIDWEPSEPDAEDLVDRFLKILSERGISARKATSEGERQLLLSFRAKLAQISPFFLRIQHREPVTYKRGDVLVTGIATTWEAEEGGLNDWSFSTSWPVVDKALGVLADELAEATSDRIEPNSAEQGGAVRPATAPDSKPEDKEKTKPESEVRPQ